MIVTVYIDESGTHSGAPNMIVGGYAARLGQCYELEKRFGILLVRNGLTYHHTKDFVQRTGEYKGWSHHKQDKFIKNASTIIRKNTLCGFTVTLKHNDYRDFYHSGNLSKSGPIDSKYGLCFRIIMSFLPMMIQKSFGDDEVEMHMVLEAGATGVGFGDTERIFDLFKKNTPPRIGRIVKTRTVANKKESRGLQIADMIAYGAFRAEQRQMTLIYFPQESSIDDAALKVPDKWPVFRLEATPAILRELKGNICCELRTQAKNT